jgi:endonuclease/exonuclease/phosphatase family metal-dependent hydrolase
MLRPRHASSLLVSLSAALAGCPPSGSGSGDEVVVLIEDEPTPEPDPRPDPDPEPSGPARLRLATWNIAFLDLPGRSAVSDRTEDDYARLAGYGERLEADVVVLQEVNGRNSAHMVFPRPEWVVECEDRESAQNVCVATRAASGWRVEVGEDYAELAVGNPRLRRGLDFTVSRPGHEPLRVLGLHMKSGCFTGDRGDACETFFDQLVMLERWIDARAREQVPFAVLGDFNRQLTAQDPAWLELDDAVPSRADLTRSIPQGTSTPCWPERYREFIDHVLLDVGAAGWLAGSGQQPYDEAGHDTWSLRLSDHCPLWADLDVPAR